MKETTDIQQFQSLFALWLEAETSLEQEQELLQLALRLAAADCPAPMRRDAELVRLSVAPRPSDAHAAEFSGFIDSLTARKTPRRRSTVWLRYAAAAAVLAFVATVGVKMMQRTPESAPAPAVSTANTPAAAEQKPMAAVRPENRAKACKPAPAEGADKSDLADRSDRSDRADRSDLADLAGSTPAAAPEQVLEPREVTDPEEAAALLAQSCTLLADCVHKAERESQKALDTFAENMNIVNEII